MGSTYFPAGAPPFGGFPPQVPRGGGLAVQNAAVLSPVELPQSVPAELQYQLSVKENQLKDLCRTRKDLEEMLEAERARKQSKDDAIRAPTTLSDPNAELRRQGEQFSAMGVEGAAIHTDLVRASEIASQLSAWHLQNLEKTKELPFAKIEASSAALTRQMEGIMAHWTQVQAIFGCAPPAASATAAMPSAPPAASTPSAPSAPVVTSAPSMSSARPAASAHASHHCAISPK